MVYKGYKVVMKTHQRYQKSEENFKKKNLVLNVVVRVAIMAEISSCPAILQSQPKLVIVVKVAMLQSFTQLFNK